MKRVVLLAIAATILVLWMSDTTVAPLSSPLTSPLHSPLAVMYESFAFSPLPPPPPSESLHHEWHEDDAGTLQWEFVGD